ncbi:MAG: hypothetical protein J2P21_21860 [Chloracidobacterium sp.]|nr:hypothetical protein [Chloracidobacterium sp.]
MIAELTLPGLDCYGVADLFFLNANRGGAAATQIMVEFLLPKFSSPRFHASCTHTSKKTALVERSAFDLLVRHSTHPFQRPLSWRNPHSALAREDLRFN